MSRGKVLVVHEEPYFPRIMQFHLEGVGYETVISDRSDRVLALIAEHHPDYVVVNVVGELKWITDLLAEIYHNPANRSVRVIPVARFFSDREVAELLRYGACGCLIEPYSPPKLLAILQKCSSTVPPAET